MDTQQLNLPAVLIILDGFGLGEPGPHNAIDMAATPVLDNLFSTCPNISIQASGEYVGLPAGQMGNSEVGHLNIGAGRVVHQELTRINNACQNGQIASNDAIESAFEVAKRPDSTLHLMGLVSDGGVHSSNEHLYTLLRAASESNVSRVLVHCFLDGRDVPPTSALAYLEELTGVIDECRTPQCSMEIASVSGRYYAMDRDNRWERVEEAYRALVCCEPRISLSPSDYVRSSYESNTTDEFVHPASFTDRGVSDNDAVVFFNFRPDRARELTHCFCDREAFPGLPTVRPFFVCLTEYDPSIPAQVAFPKTFPENVLADVVSEAGLRQYHIAETEKYAHVTFFLNGGREQEKVGEERTLIPSPKVATYDLKPEMSEPEVASTLSAAIDNNEADVYVVNFANCDMVGHTGVIPAAIAAVEAVDAGVGEVLAAVKRAGGVAIVAADHGNADVMIADDGTPHTAHTTNPVPMIIVDYSGNNFEFVPGAQGALCNLSPTLLDIIGLDRPVEMTADSLLLPRR